MSFYRAHFCRTCLAHCLAALLLLLTLSRNSLPAAEDSPLSPTEITSQKLESVSTDKEMKTVLTGDVVVKATNLEITCERVEVISLRKGAKDQLVAKQNRFKSLIATGRVRITQSDRVATCGRAVVLPGDDKITLTQNPMVVDQSAGFTWIGDELVLLRSERRVFGQNVKIIGPPIKDLGFDPGKKIEPPSPSSSPDRSAPPTITVPQTAPKP